MCLGIPMQVVSTAPGHAHCRGRGVERRVRTALVGPVQAGDWLLVFLDDAQERIDAGRAQEIGATLDLLQAAMARQADGTAAMDAAFPLPSRLSRDELMASFNATVPTENIDER